MRGICLSALRGMSLCALRRIGYNALRCIGLIIMRGGRFLIGGRVEWMMHRRILLMPMNFLVDEFTEFLLLRSGPDHFLWKDLLLLKLTTQVVLILNVMSGPASIASFVGSGGRSELTRGVWKVGHNCRKQFLD